MSRTKRPLETRSHSTVASKGPHRRRHASKTTPNSQPRPSSSESEDIELKKSRVMTDEEKSNE